MRYQTAPQALATSETLAPRSACLEIRSWPAAGAAAQAPGDLDPVEVRQADVEQHDLWAKPLDGFQPFGAGAALADHVEAVGFEQGSRGVAEPGVIIDYENGLRHRDQNARRGSHSKAR